MAKFRARVPEGDEPEVAIVELVGVMSDFIVFLGSQVDEYDRALPRNRCNDPGLALRNTCVKLRAPTLNHSA